MNFLERIFQRLAEAGDAPVLREIRGNELVPASGKDLLALIAEARTFIVATGLAKGDRCALLAPNSIRWAALDLALMAEGVIVVPLYARQAANELAVMIQDSGAARICCENAELRAAIAGALRNAPAISMFDEIFGARASSPSRSSPAPSQPLAPSDPVTIIYTSGTSGEAKGVVLTEANVDYMLSCTTARLDQLMGERAAPEQVFHYLPFNFAASWISLLSYFSRKSVVTLSTDLTKLADEMRIAAPNYFLNVPALLERVRTKIEENIRGKSGWIAALYAKAKRAYLSGGAEKAGTSDRAALAAARALIFPTVRQGLGAQLTALICGSAPLAVETQKFFMMLGIPVLQAYGLTETTAICTLDDPNFVEPGYVGPAIPGIEMKLGENQEILVRGPNIFSGYWNRPEETAKALRDGWFHTGDQGEVNQNGRWKITGRIKNLIILNSGHNIAPEPLEEELTRHLPGAQVMLAGNGRSYLVALVAAANSELTDAKASAAIEEMNERLPHYRKIRAFHLVGEPFTMESGMLTANGKLKRDAVAAQFKTQIEQLYRKREA
ncbi:MAG TPA: AMP-binding protein [Candidatus Acidoferrales bacterium]|nr:AMP-binding protein [Candidatus Acidoferrales bacterium]